MTNIPALALVATLLSISPALAGPAPQGDGAGRGMALSVDPDSDAGRLAAARAMSAVAGRGMDAFADSLRLRALLDARPREGLGVEEVRTALARPGLSTESHERRVQAVMATDADGDGRVTRSEYLTAGAATLGGLLASIKGAIPNRGDPSE